LRREKEKKNFQPQRDPGIGHQEDLLGTRKVVGIL
jgi:hypothetical protein